MTPADFRAARKALGLTQTGMAEALRLSPANGSRSIRIWEKDGNTVPGPVQVAVELLVEKQAFAAKSRKIPSQPDAMQSKRMKGKQNAE